MKVNSNSRNLNVDGSPEVDHNVDGYFGMSIILFVIWLVKSLRLINNDFRACLINIKMNFR